MLGTPRFFSPEQALGRPVDARSDLYSAAAVLYTMVAGRGPFDHYNALYQLAQAHASERPEPPSRFTAQLIPEALERAILKALAKRPEDRFQTAADFTAALDAIALEPAPRPPGAPAPRRWDTTEPLRPTDGLAGARALPSLPTASPPCVISPPSALASTAPLHTPELALPPAPVLPFIAPPPSPASSLAIGPSSPPRAAPWRARAAPWRALLFLLAMLASAVVAGALTAAVLLRDAQ
jgi:serine/threonine protein kinase